MFKNSENLIQHFQVQNINEAFTFLPKQNVSLGAIVTDTVGQSYCVIDLDNLNNHAGYQPITIPRKARTANAHNGKFKHTGASIDTIHDSILQIVNDLDTYRDAFTITDGIEAPEVLESGTPRYPIVCIINGYAGTGKDAFMDATASIVSAARVSSIDPVVELADYLINKDFSLPLWDSVEDPAKEKTDKTDAYRELLAGLKTAWMNFDKGPELHSLYRISELITEQTDGNNCLDVIYVIIREPENIFNFRKRVIEELGLICITLFIKGWKTSEDVIPEESDIENYDYDLTITNTLGKFSLFKVQAAMFAATLMADNQRYGIPLSSDDYTLYTAPSDSDLQITVLDKSTIVRDDKFNC